MSIYTEPTLAELQQPVSEETLAERRRIPVGARVHHRDHGPITAGAGKVLRHLTSSSEPQSWALVAWPNGHVNRQRTRQLRRLELEPDPRAWKVRRATHWIDYDPERPHHVRDWRRDGEGSPWKAPISRRATQADLAALIPRYRAS